MILFDVFKQVILKVARIKEAQGVEGSEKLIQLTLDAGTDDQRTIVAGIGTRYTPEALIGREIIIVANLEPRMLMGVESNGMLLAANSTDGPVLLAPDAQVDPGTLIR